MEHYVARTITAITKLSTCQEQFPNASRFFCTTTCPWPSSTNSQSKQSPLSTSVPPKHFTSHCDHLTQFLKKPLDKSASRRCLHAENTRTVLMERVADVGHFGRGERAQLIPSLCDVCLCDAISRTLLKQFSEELQN